MVVVVGVGEMSPQTFVVPFLGLIAEVIVVYSLNSLQDLKSYLIAAGPNNVPYRCSPVVEVINFFLRGTFYDCNSFI